jgi:hypothetical protein
VNELSSKVDVDRLIDAAGNGVTIRRPPLKLECVTSPAGVAFEQRGNGFGPSALLIAAGVVGLSCVLFFSFGMREQAIITMLGAIAFAIYAVVCFTNNMSVRFDFSAKTATYSSRKYGFTIGYTIPLDKVTIYVCQVDIQHSHRSWNDGFGVVVQMGEHGHMLAICLDRDPQVVQRYATELPDDLKRLITPTKAHIFAIM